MMESRDSAPRLPTGGDTNMEKGVDGGESNTGGSLEQVGREKNPEPSVSSSDQNSATHRRPGAADDGEGGMREEQTEDKHEDAEVSRREIRKNDIAPPAESIRESDSSRPPRPQNTDQTEIDPKEEHQEDATNPGPPVQEDIFDSDPPPTEPSSAELNSEVPNDETFPIQNQPTVEASHEQTDPNSDDAVKSSQENGDEAQNRRDARFPEPKTSTPEDAGNSNGSDKGNEHAGTSANRNRGGNWEQLPTGRGYEGYNPHGHSWCSHEPPSGSRWGQQDDNLGSTSESTDRQEGNSHLVPVGYDEDEAIRRATEASIQDVLDPTARQQDSESGDAAQATEKQSLEDRLKRFQQDEKERFRATCSPPKHQQKLAGEARVEAQLERLEGDKTVQGGDNGSQEGQSRTGDGKSSGKGSASADPWTSLGMDMWDFFDLYDTMEVYETSVQAARNYEAIAHRNRQSQREQGDGPTEFDREASEEAEMKRAMIEGLRDNQRPEEDEDHEAIAHQRLLTQREQGDGPTEFDWEAWEASEEAEIERAMIESLQDNQRSEVGSEGSSSDRDDGDADDGMPDLVPGSNISAPESNVSTRTRSPPADAKASGEKSKEDEATDSNSQPDSKKGNRKGDSRKRDGESGDDKRHGDGSREYGESHGDDRGSDANRGGDQGVNQDENEDGHQGGGYQGGNDARQGSDTTNPGTGGTSESQETQKGLQQGRRAESDKERGEQTVQDADDRSRVWDQIQTVSLMEAGREDNRQAENRGNPVDSGEQEKEEEEEEEEMDGSRLRHYAGDSRARSDIHSQETALHRDGREVEQEAQRSEDAETQASGEVPVPSSANKDDSKQASKGKKHRHQGKKTQWQIKKEGKKRRNRETAA